MADDRPVEGTEAEVGNLRRDLDDLKSTILARVIRRPTGDIEPTIRTTPKANTLLLDGSAVSRTTYAELWAWAQEQSLVVTGLFTVGDGSTTFGLPDFRGRVVRGKGAAEAIGLLSGADSVTLATANLPSHNHSVSIADHDQHRHGFLTDQDGAHGGHFPGSQVNVQSGGSFGVSPWNSTGTGVGTHNHGGDTAYVPISNHVVTQSNVGSGTAIDNRQASVNINWAVWI